MFVIALNSVIKDFQSPKMLQNKNPEPKKYWFHSRIGGLTNETQSEPSFLSLFSSGCGARVEPALKNNSVNEVAYFSVVNHGKPNNSLTIPNKFQ